MHTRVISVIPCRVKVNVDEVQAFLRGNGSCRITTGKWEVSKHGK